MSRRAQHQFSSFKGGVKGGVLIILLLSLFACEEKPDGLLSKGEMEASLVYYNRHTAQIRDIYQHVQRKLEDYDSKLQLESGSNEIRASFTLGGDTADIWSGHRMMILRNNPYLNKETFIIHADTSFYLNDHFRLALDVDFIREDQNNRDNNITACLSVHFERGGLPLRLLSLPRRQQ